MLSVRTDDNIFLEECPLPPIMSLNVNRSLCPWPSASLPINTYRYLYQYLLTAGYMPPLPALCCWGAIIAWGAVGAAAPVSGYEAVAYSCLHCIVTWAQVYHCMQLHATPQQALKRLKIRHAAGRVCPLKFSVAGQDCDSASIA